jgi:hypothetical protein
MVNFITIPNKDLSEISQLQINNADRQSGPSGHTESRRTLDQKDVGRQEMFLLTPAPRTK